MTRMPAADREFDVVLFGATGFTGGLTAEYLARNAPAGLKWAIAGRNEVKLKRVREHLATIDPTLGSLPTLIADADRPVTIGDAARRTRVVASTVGPFLEHGEPLVAACAEAGTDYADITGEPEFVDRMYLAHHDQAIQTGARLVHCCGFDSIPHDLGARFTVQALTGGDPDPDLPITMRGVVRSSGTFSGGTFHSALAAMARQRVAKQVFAERRRAEGRPAGGRRSRAVAAKPQRDPVLGYWLLPLPTIDPIVVARSGAALPAYGPDFRYSHFAGTKTLRYAAGGAVGVTALAAGAQVKPVREFLQSKVPQGSGPDPKRRARSWFSVDFVAEAGSGSDLRRVRTRVNGGDPGYDETAKMLAESALCLAFDDNPETSGQVTTAVAMGEALTARLQRGGIDFTVKE